MAIPVPLPIAPPNAWPNRLAWLLACATFPLIWMGGHVTTYGAGMAVPDWPTTFGWNPFLYPWDSWVKVWDVFLEHSHRQIGWAVGAIAIAAAVTVWLADRRRSARWLAVGALLAVSSQGVLGGLRVIENRILLAKVHGCSAPLVFSLIASLVVITSRPWRQIPRDGGGFIDRGFRAVAPLVTLGIYCQIVLGAQLRHLLPGESFEWFDLCVWLHLAVAGGVLVGLLWLLQRAVARLRGKPMLTRRVALLVLLFLLQLGLGAATWIVKYGWPGWFVGSVWSVPYTVDRGPLEAIITTTHVAVGSLCLVVSLSVTLWTRRLVGDVGNALCGVPRPGGHSTSASAALPTNPSPPTPLPQGKRGVIFGPPLGRAAAGEYWQLVRPRIVAMVLLTMLIAAIVAGSGIPPWPTLLSSLGGTALVIAGAIALNQRLEHRSDARMRRTAARPLPNGRITSGQATWFGLIASAAGLLWLALAVNPVVLLLASVSWVVYVWVYTPMKALTAWQTPLGALAGAMPVLLGAATAGVPWGSNAMALFGVLFFWQFPHAMAIGWIYRDQFAAAELRLASVTDSTGRTAGLVSLLGAALLLPVSLLPSMAGPLGWPYGAIAGLLGFAYLAFSVIFFHRPNDLSARRLLWASLVYLPILSAAILVAVLAAR